MKSGQSCLVPDFSGIGLSFFPFNLVLAVDLLRTAFIIFKHVPYIPELPQDLYHEGVLDFVKCFFQHLMK